MWDEAAYRNRSHLKRAVNRQSRPFWIGFGAATCVEAMQNPKENFHVSMLRNDDKPNAFCFGGGFHSGHSRRDLQLRAEQDTQELSSVRSDAAAWDISVMLLAAPLTTAGVSDMRTAQSTVTSAGDDSIGGYETVKYMYDSVSPIPRLKKLAIKSCCEHEPSASWVLAGSGGALHDENRQRLQFHTKDGTPGLVHSEGSAAKRGCRAR